MVEKCLEISGMCSAFSFCELCKEVPQEALLSFSK